MNKIINNKKMKLCAGIIILVLALLIVFFRLLFWNSSYSVTQVKVTASLVDKVQETQKQGGILKLNEEELDQIISMYFKKEKSLAGITVKAIDGDIVNNDLAIYAPVTYKSFNMLLSSEGSLSYENDKIQYKPLYFRIGKINLPKDFVLNKFKSSLKDNVTIENGVMAVNKSIIPVTIKSVEVKNNEILIGIEKLATTLEEKLKSIQSKVKDDLSSGSATSDSSSDTANNSANSSSGQETSNSQTSSDNKDTSQMNAALDRISSGLSSAMGSVSTGGQKTVITAMISATNSMKGNPNANPYAAAGGVRAVYNKLSPQEKKELKAAVFSNVNGTDINIVSSMIGK